MVTRQEAIEQGLLKYDSTKPCSKGHIGLRYVLSGTCVVCTGEASKRSKARVLALRRAIQTSNPQEAG